MRSLRAGKKQRKKEKEILVIEAVIRILFLLQNARFLDITMAKERILKLVKENAF